MTPASLPTDATVRAMFRRHAASSPDALRTAIVHVEHYGDTSVPARSVNDAESAELTHWQIEGDMRRKVKASFVRWVSA